MLYCAGVLLGVVFGMRNCSLWFRDAPYQWRQR